MRGTVASEGRTGEAVLPSEIMVYYGNIQKLWYTASAPGPGFTVMQTVGLKTPLPQCRFGRVQISSCVN